MAATITTAQKALITVTTSTGEPAGPGTFTVNPEGIASVSGGQLEAHYLVAIAPGSATLIVDNEKGHGELPFTVELDTLVVTLGTPEPK